MKLSTFLAINAALFIPFGIGMLMMPSEIFPLIGVLLNGDGLLMASTVGSMLFSFGLICLLGRNVSLESSTIIPLLAGNMSFHLIDSILTFKGAISGVMNTLGFMFSGMHFILGIGFLLFIMKSIKTRKGIPV